jgi:hypothetical protein
MKYLKLLISPVFMGILFVLFALAMAVATFIENDFGSPAAYSLVYNTRWFELMLLLLAVNLVGQLIVFKLFKLERLPGALFHLSFLVMIIGSGITRYFGWEGSIHIRDGEEQNECFSNEKYIGYSVFNTEGKIIAENNEKYSLTSVSAENYKKTIRINNKEYVLALVKIVPSASQPGSMNAENQNTFVFNVTGGGENTTVNLIDRESEKVTTGSVDIEGTKVQISYGSKITRLPFTIKLNKFILERYPGSNSPSGYKSDVVLIDKNAQLEKPFMIFMNNILKYKGYRFYQSSFDRDERGTILSVNHDMAGMLVTYSGYTLLFIFIILSMINKNSVFHNINAGYWKSGIRKAVPLILFLLLLSGLSPLQAQKITPDKAVSVEFGKVLVQDQKGRTKPLFTLSNDILRKVTRENEFEGMNSMQVFLGLYLDFNGWKDVPLISISNKDLQRKLGISGKYAAFSDLVDVNGIGAYKISDEVNSAYSKSPGERSKQDKEVMKVDERMNIIFMIYKGDFFKLFPLKDGTHNWGTTQEALKGATSKEDSTYLNNIIPTIRDAVQSNNLSRARQIAGSISEYQTKQALM